MIKVIGVHKNEDGDIVEFKCNDSCLYSYDQMIKMVQNNEVEDLMLGGARDGSTTIRGVADGNPDNNLANLPTY